MIKKFNGNPAIILLIEDNEADVVLAREALGESKVSNQIFHVKDGLEALDFLNKTGRYANMPRPDLILLDLNMPKMDGREFLEEIKNDESKTSIPIIVLTTSEADKDIAKSYNLNVNCCIQKPVDFEQFIAVVQSIEHFWFTVVSLPNNPEPLE